MTDAARDGLLHSLSVDRRIPADREQVLHAWTDPDTLQRWWGPPDVDCVGAEVDLRVGGHYRIGNGLPDGSVIWIHGEYLQIDAPSLLVYTWGVDGSDAAAQRVTVRFETAGDATLVRVVHEQITSVEAREGHSAGWNGCLEGLVSIFD